MSAALVLTHSGDRTADYLCDRLGGRVPLLRLDTDALPDDLDASFDRGPRLRAHGREVAPETVRAVWYRRPGPLRPPGRPAEDPYEEYHRGLEWAEALNGVLALVPAERWINHPARNAGASHKIEQLARARSLGLHTPRTLVTRDLGRLLDLWRETDGCVIAKPLASGYLERDDPSDDTAIYTSALTRADIDDPPDLAGAPTLFQERIEKRLDVRVTLVDGHAVALGLADLVSETPRLDIRRDEMRGVAYEPVDLPDDIERGVCDLVASYGLRFAAVDLAVDDDGRWVFFEVNPNGQWAWLDLVGGAEIWTLFERAFQP